MNPTTDSARQWSRRELLRVAGLSGLTAATMSMAGSVPLSALAASTTDDTPEAFLVTAYATRAQAMSTGDVSNLAALYDPASSTLLHSSRSAANSSRATSVPAGRMLRSSATVPNSSCLT